MKFKHSSPQTLARENRRLLNLGTNIRKLRRLRGWTQTQLALRAGLDQTHVSSIEIGRRDANPSLLCVMRIAQALKVPPHALCTKIER